MWLVRLMFFFCCSRLFVVAFVVNVVYIVASLSPFKHYFSAESRATGYRLRSPGLVLPAKKWQRQADITDIDWHCLLCGKDISFIRNVSFTYCRPHEMFYILLVCFVFWLLLLLFYIWEMSIKHENADQNTVLLFLAFFFHFSTLHLWFWAFGSKEWYLRLSFMINNGKMVYIVWTATELYVFQICIRTY